ncbi:MAG: VOC family protein [Chloroflexi bacterium]|nr:VOC family protein [Chloroflexota bacterium]
MPIKTKGVNHPALIGRSYGETVKFYTEILGMRLVLDQPNLDEPRMTHLFFDAGNGGFIAYFVVNDGTDLELPRARDGIGAMGHVALNLDGPIEEAMETLREHGIRFHGPIDRGYERSIYFKDPNGVLVELLTWITPLPEGADETEVIARATELRKAEGAHHIEDAHVRRAMEEMGYKLER